MDRMDAYAVLRREGHSPEKALEIAIDYERGDRYAVKWVHGLAERQGSRVPHDPL